MKLLRTVGILAALTFAVTASAQKPEKGAAVANPTVVMKTSMGSVKIELYPDKAPDTVKNFLQYVDDKFYDGTIFHRVINGFMVQGGGFDKAMGKKDTRAPIKNEAKTGVKNATGTIAMARTSDPNSATAQFFINVVDNAMLNHTAKTPSGWGYAVFGKVVQGKEVVDAIKAVPTGRKGGMADVPVEPVEILKAEVVAK
jgi:cyclophilin family peptidyl-prolyl cis-trans isomerase